MGDTKSGRKRCLFLGEEGTGKTTSIRVLTSSNRLEFHEVTFKGHKITFTDGRNMHGYRKHYPDNSKTDVVVLALSHERLQSPFQINEEQIKDTIGKNFQKKILLLILFEPDANGGVATLSEETDDLMSNADETFKRFYKRYCCSPVAIKLPNCGFLQTTELFENLIEMNSENQIEGKKNDIPTIKVLVIGDGTKASLVRDIALSMVSKTENVEFYDFELEKTKDEITFIDTPPLNDLLANREFFKDIFSQIDVVVLLVKKLKLPMPFSLQKLKDALGVKFYNRFVIGINLFGKDWRKYHSIKNHISAMLKIFHNDSKVFLLPDLASNSGESFFSDIKESLKRPEGSVTTLEEMEKYFVLSLGRDNNLVERSINKVTPKSAFVEMGDVKFWEVQVDSYCLVYLNLPVRDKSSIHKTFLQICKDGVHSILLDEADSSILEILQRILPKEAQEFVFQFTTDEDFSHLDKMIKMTMVRKFRKLPPPIKMKDCNVLFIGENGSGKSSTINTILGRPVFETGHIWSAKETITKDVQSYTYVNENYDVAFGRNITLIDTQNFERLKRNTKFQKAIQSGIDVVVMVVKIDRLTQYRLEFFAKVLELFPVGVFDHMMVILPLVKRYLKIASTKFIEAGKKEMEQFVEKINGRHITFCNTSHDLALLQRYQEDFFRTLDLIVKSNNMKCIHRTN